MADIVADDVTTTILFRSFAGKTVNQGNQLLMDVAVEWNIEPGTTDTYPTGGIPLTNCFTSGNAKELGFDLKKPIVEVGRSIARIDTGVTLGAVGMFYNGGTAATDQKLVLFKQTTAAAARVSVSGTTLAAVNSGNVITDSGNGLAVFRVGEPILISGFTGTAANNQVGVISAVAAGQISVTTAVAFVNDAAGETVTLTSLWPADGGLAQMGNVDVTGAQGILGADEEIVYRTVLRGFKRQGFTALVN